jgi:hypothetical protein
VSDLALWARRHAVVPAGAACLATALLMRRWAGVTVDLPLGVRSAPLWIVLPALMGMLSLPVASTPHSELERQSLRLTRRFRLAVGLVSTAIAMLGTVVMVDRPIATPVAAWTLGLCGCGLVAVRLVGPAAWAPMAVLAIGLTSVAAGGTGPDLVSASADRYALAAATCWWALALAVYGLAEPGSAVRVPQRLASDRRPTQEDTPWQPR